MTRVFNLRTFLWIFVCVDSISGQESKCCTKVTGSCRSACEKLSLASAASDSEYREQRLLDVHNFCSHLLVSFWQCINQTLDEISKGEGWPGRACCALPQSERCQQACITASGRRDLAHNCRQSDELAFFTCLDKQQMADECCATAQSDDCKVACRTIFRSEMAPNRNAKTALLHACGEASPRTVSCVNNITKSATVQNPSKLMHCCEQASNVDCHNTCRQILQQGSSTDQEIIDSLQEGGCGPPLLHEKIWQCFLQGAGDSAAPSVESSLIDRMGMDSAKLHCCQNARSPTCRRLCLHTFSTEWTQSWDDFSSQCLQQLSEDSLVHCLDEVEEPCELSCDGLGYCTNFNNRPTELFRSCTPQADDAARYDVALWTSKGVLSLPGLQIPVRNISQCSPLTWKAVACTLQIKPCHRTTHTNRICRQDCFSLLSQCMDWTRMPPDTSAATICGRLSPENPVAPCVSLEPYLEPSDQPYSAPMDHVTQPCKGEPCSTGQLCHVNRYCSLTHSCQPYSCAVGCKLGEVSQHLVPAGSYVRVPVSAGNKGCLKVCQCSADGDIESCQPLPCFPLEACWISGNHQEHGTSFYIECNFCNCYAGEVTCTRKQCEVAHVGHGLTDVTFTSLPCNCPPHHVPVCGRHGRTFPNACLAKCAGLNDVDFKFGSCEEKDPCASNPCGEDEACLPARRVCLSLLHSPCPQHQCVNIEVACNSQESSPVCDTDGQQHPNPCYLRRHGKTLAYHGPCLTGCNKTGLVCGIDGNTYQSECVALARGVQVDYNGPCLAVGVIGEQARPQCSSAVTCPPLSFSGCLGVTPPGACCPVCAGAIRLLYSQKQVDRALYALKSSESVSAMTLQTVIEALDRHVTVAECVVRGSLTVELDLLALVVPLRPSPSQLQLQACVSEAEKLANLVRLSSPKLVAELSLGSLTASRVVHSEVHSSGKPLRPSVVILTPTFILVLGTLTQSLFLLLREHR